MAGKCEDCNKPYVQFRAESSKNSDGVFQTKRYYRCEKCGTVYVEIDPPQDENYHKGVMMVEKYPAVKQGENNLDKWLFP